MAVIFDFDDTLAPDSTSELLREHGVDPERFYLTDVKALRVQGYDTTHAYLRCLLDLIGEGKPLGPLTNRDLKDIGKKLNAKFFPGLPEIFADLRKIVSQYRDIGIEFYIISGGLQEIIEGTDVVGSWGFSGVYGCQLAGDTQEGVLRHIKRAITFTEKTRYLFEINKGLTPDAVLRDPYAVNTSVPHNQRRIRMANMVYVGDGLTDIPCFSLLKQGAGDPEGGGISFAVFDPARTKSAKQALDEYLRPSRVLGAHAPDFTKDRELGAFIRAAVATKCSRIGLREVEPE